MLGKLGRLIKGDEGAVAPTLALSLFGLLAIGGVAFDYARLAALDTELQSAADQAALAAATQLDGNTGACARAAAAASGLLSNQALFANDGGGMAVKVANETGCDATGSIRFYQSYNTTDDTFGAAATSDANAKIVQIAVNPRTANFALTPVVGAISSGNLNAEAVASLDAGAICKIAPLMVCNPNEGKNSPAFPQASDVGKGLLLVPGGGNDPWGPGNYGYLNLGNGANGLERAMGSDLNQEPCITAGGVETKTGNNASVTDAVNTRFDLFNNGLVNYCDRDANGNTNCSPAKVVGKDVVHSQFTGNGAAPNELAASGNGGSGDNCGLNGADSWRFVPKRYEPTSDADVTNPSQIPDAMGLPRDRCHSVSATGTCTDGKFGNGTWDRNLYFYVNYYKVGKNAAGGNNTPLYTPANPNTPDGNWQNITSLAAWASANGVTLSTISRYNVYRWELSRAVPTVQADFLTRREAANFKKLNGQGNETGQPVQHYSYNTPRCAVGKSASSTVKDRRLLVAAVVNCTAQNIKGNTTATPSGWVDLFLTEPSLDRPNSRTSKDQIYVEVVGVAKRPSGEDAFQYYFRQRPRLLK